MDRTKTVTDAKDEHTNAKGAMCVFEGWAAMDRAAMRGTMEDHDRVQGKLATTLEKLQVAKGALSAIID